VLGFRDVTDRVRLERELVRQALTDPLTGLANRALFNDRVVHALARAGRDPGRVATMLIDLDGFKLVNDGLGHGAGDAVLVAVADRLRNAVRDGDTVARLGGDEFAVLLEDVRTPEEANAAALRMLAALATPVSAPTEVFVGASIGVATATTEDDAGTLLRHADIAMYIAKARGKGQHVHFERQMRERAVARVHLEADLRAAVGEIPAGTVDFHVVYQPIIALDTARLASAEALLRWQHPERGLVLPLDFIPVAEETGLIVPLGLWVLGEACREAAAWPAGPDGIAPGVSVNLSGRQLQEASLVDDVRAVLARTGLPAERLTLEITESVVMRDTTQTLACLRALKALGVRLAIDDFGTGHSSLAYLRQFPVDVLKIDKSFVDGLAHGGDAAALARTIIALADTLQLHTVAEGIETVGQQAALEALGCGLGQGYLFARPMAAADLARLLAGNGTAVAA
jgi:diguanylate cyclase (GGDEF)-like protein